MIVPEFKLKQSDSHVLVYIRVPYIKVSACEFYIETSTFKFYLKPYLLSLTFEQPLREVEEPSKAIYYHEKYML
jgi:protein SHQ1